MKFMDNTIVKGTVVNDRLVEKGGQVLYGVYNRFPLVFERGEGVYLYDAAGNEYLDFGAGIAVCGLGYGNALFQKALKDRIDTGLLHTSNLFYNEPAIEAGEKLLAVTGMEKVFFTNSGTEAIEGALKLARRYQYNRRQDAQKEAAQGGEKDQNGGKAQPPEAGRIEIIAMQDSFHGRSIGAVSVTGKEAYREPFAPLLPGVRFAKYNDLSSVEALLNEHTGAILLETLQGEGGIYPATKEFLQGIRRICDERDILLILDEIQCGMGRTGYMFAYQEYGVLPDVLAVAKAIGNGVPIGAFLARGEAASAMRPGDHGSTYGGNPLVCAAASIVLDIFKEMDLPAHAAEMGAFLWEKLEELRQKFPDKITDHRGKGLIQGLQFQEGVDVAEIVRDALLVQRLVLISAAHNTIRFVPPLVIERKHIEQCAERLSAVLA